VRRRQGSFSFLPTLKEPKRRNYN